MAGPMSAFTLAAVLMIASGSIHAIVNAMIKGSGDQFARVTLLNFSSSLIIAPALFLVPLPHGAWGYLLAGVAVHAVYFYLLASVLSRADFSSSYPVYRGAAPLITAAGALLILDQPLRPAELAGIAMIGGGTLFLLAGRHLDGMTVMLALATGAATAAYTLIDAAGVRAAPTPFSFIVWLFALMGLGTMLLVPVLSGTRLMPVARANGGWLLVGGGLSIVTFGTALYALSLGPVAQLAALRETGMVTALAISTLVFRERVTMARAAAVITICGGAVIILSG